MNRLPAIIVAAALPVAALLPLAAAAQTFYSTNHLEVVPIGPRSFEVIERSTSGVRDAWCAGADYVRRVLGDPVRARLYLIKPDGPSQIRPGRRSVAFTIAPDAAMQARGPSHSASLSDVGRNLSAKGSYQFCRDLVLEIIED